MKKLILIYFIAFNFSTVLNAQAPDTTWTKSLGGTGNDKAYFIQQTTDGGYIVAGSSDSCLIMKLNTDGDITWTKSFGQVGSVIYSIQQTIDGGYIACGFWNGVQYNNGSFGVIKFNPSGWIEWNKSFGGISVDAKAYSVKQTSDGYIVAGYTRAHLYGNENHQNLGFNASDYYIVKLNTSGGLVDQKCFGGDAFDNANSINLTNDGGYIVAGGNEGTNILGGNYFGVKKLKLDINGLLILDPLWPSNSHYYGVGEAYSIQTIIDGYIVAGISAGGGYIVKLNTDGDTTWTKSLSGGIQQAHSIQQTTDGGYIVAGYSSNNSNYFIVKLYSDGEIAWQKSLGGTDDDKAYSIQQTSDGGYIVVGSSKSTNGDVIGNNGGYDFWIVKLNPDNGGTVSIKDDENKFSVYPNPNVGSFTLEILNTEFNKAELTIVDISGRQIYQASINTQKSTIDISGFSKGIYFLSLFDGEQYINRKIVKE